MTVSETNVLMLNSGTNRFPVWRVEYGCEVRAVVPSAFTVAQADQIAGTQSTRRDTCSVCDGTWDVQDGLCKICTISATFDK